MPAFGCLVPFITLTLGTAFGVYEGSVYGGYWGAAIGACIGLLAGVTGFLVLGHVRDRDA